MTEKSPISILQEMAQIQRIPQPLYSVQIEGMKFRVTLKLGNGEDIFSEAVGQTKQLAKQLCAENAVKLLNSENAHFAKGKIEDLSKVSSLNELSENYVGKLNEHCAKKMVAVPEYSECESVNGKFIIECKLFATTTRGESRTKKNAKQRAAQAMLEVFGVRYKSHVQNLTELHEVEFRNITTDITVKPSSPIESFKNHVGKLNEMFSTRRGLTYIEYRTDSGEFIVECKLFDNIITRGQSRTKKDAKQKAAEAMLSRIRQSGNVNLSESLSSSTVPLHNCDEQKAALEMFQLFAKSSMLERKDLMKSVTIIDNTIDIGEKKPMEELVKESDLPSVEHMNEEQLEMELQNLNVIYKISTVPRVRNALMLKTKPTKNCRALTFISVGKKKVEMHLDLLRKAVFGVRVLKT